MKKLSLVFAAALLGACATDSDTADASTADKAGAAQTAENATQAISQAEAASKRADEVGYQWRDTEELIKQAKAAADKKDYAAAVNLAQSAKQQSELGYQQYQANQKGAK